MLRPTVVLYSFSEELLDYSQLRTLLCHLVKVERKVTGGRAALAVPARVKRDNLQRIREAVQLRGEVGLSGPWKSQPPQQF